MAIAFDAHTNGGSSASYSHTTTGSGLILFVGVYSLADNVTAVSYGGVSMTLVGKASNGPDGSTEVYMFYLVNPLVGANNVVITGGTSINSDTVSYTGTPSPAVIDSSNTFSGLSTSANQSISTTVAAANSWAVVYVRNSAANNVYNSGVTTTQRGTASPQAWFDSNGTVSTGSQTTNIKIATGTAGWSMVMASFYPIDQTITISDTTSLSESLGMTTQYHVALHDTVSLSDLISFGKTLWITAVRSVTSWINQIRH